MSEVAAIVDSRPALTVSRWERKAAGGLAVLLGLLWFGGINLHTHVWNSLAGLPTTIPQFWVEHILTGEFGPEALINSFTVLHAALIGLHVGMALGCVVLFPPAILRASGRQRWLPGRRLWAAALAHGFLVIMLAGVLSRWETLDSLGLPKAYQGWFQPRYLWKFWLQNPHLFLYHVEFLLAAVVLWVSRPTPVNEDRSADGKRDRGSG